MNTHLTYDNANKLEPVVCDPNIGEGRKNNSDSLEGLVAVATGNIVINKGGFMNYSDLMKQNPTYLKTVCGYDCYEHPVHGDEAPIIIVKDHQVINCSCFYECEDIELEMDNNGTILSEYTQA